MRIYRNFIALFRCMVGGALPMPRETIEATWLKVEEAYLQLQKGIDQTSEPARQRMEMPAELLGLPRQTVQSDRSTSAAPGVGAQEP